MASRCRCPIDGKWPRVAAEGGDDRLSGSGYSNTRSAQWFIGSSCGLGRVGSSRHGGVAMLKPALIAFGVVCCALGIVAVAADASHSRSYEPVLNPKDFSLAITNPYFPLPVGRTWVYRGTKDGQTQIDRVTVTARTKRVAEGITARVVRDVATHNGKLLEKTFDYYAQDKHGRVWYVGENTTAYLPNGKTDTSARGRRG
jgi:hypothetical protein